VRGAAPQRQKPQGLINGDRCRFGDF